MAEKQHRERIKYFFLGVIVVIGTLLLMGARLLDQEETVLLDVDRYRIAAWGDGQAHGAFVLDSITGETKIVYRIKEIGDDKLLERSHLNLRFTEIP